MPVTPPFYVQAAYRWYNDGTGGESGSSAVAAQDTAYSVSLSGDQNVVLRLGVTNSGDGSATDDWQLQVSKDGGSYADINTGSASVKAFNSLNLTDGGATTQRLTGMAGSFAAGQISEDGLADNQLIAINNNTEFLFTLTLIYADLLTNNTLDFRVLVNGVVLDAYSSVPRINIGIASGRDEGFAFPARNPNKNVGPMALRYGSGRQSYFPATTPLDSTDPYIGHPFIVARTSLRNGQLVYHPMKGSCAPPWPLPFTVPGFVTRYWEDPSSYPFGGNSPNPRLLAGAKTDSRFGFGTGPDSPRYRVYHNPDQKLNPNDGTMIIGKPYAGVLAGLRDDMRTYLVGGKKCNCRNLCFRWGGTDDGPLALAYANAGAHGPFGDASALAFSRSGGYRCDPRFDQRPSFFHSDGFGNATISCDTYNTGTTENWGFFINQTTGIDQYTFVESAEPLSLDPVIVVYNGTYQNTSPGSASPGNAYSNNYGGVAYQIIFFESLTGP